MALNKYMHPRNIYKTPPDFEKLSKDYEEFGKIAKKDVFGKVTINFKDPNSLRVLTKCLLKADFELDVEIPEDRLVPTLPLRLNYILWLEDLMNAIKRTADVRGIDIGTGACAIYLLLAAKKNKWQMLGTEADPVSLQNARENINRNNLQDIIETKYNQEGSLIENLFSENNAVIYDFCMCNPPFYSNIQELCESRSPARLPPKNGFTGSPHELITEGGELEFCRKLIKESKNCKDKVLVFTTMVGHKYNLSELLEDLKVDKIKHTHTEFCQGRVTRWGLAWTFKDYDIYKLVPPREKPRKKNVPMLFQLTEVPNTEMTLESTYNKLKHILTDLKIVQKIINKRGNHICLDILAKTNTWSNQRRRKRLLKKVETDAKKIRLDKEEGNGESIADGNSSQQEEPETNSSQQETSELNSCQKEGSKSNTIEISQQLSEVEHDQDAEPLVQAFLKLYKKDGNTIFLEMDFTGGSGGKESMHQIMQYIKNNWK